MQPTLPLIFAWDRRRCLSRWSLPLALEDFARCASLSKVAPPPPPHPTPHTTACHIQYSSSFFSLVSLSPGGLLISKRGVLSSSTRCRLVASGAWHWQIRHGHFLCLQACSCALPGWLDPRYTYLSSDCRAGCVLNEIRRTIIYPGVVGESPWIC
jgi:hypothetical protein